VQEIVIEKKPIGETQAGHELLDEVDEAIKKGQKNLHELDSEYKDAAAGEDEELTVSLGKEKEDAQTDLQRKEAEKKRLRKLERRAAGQSFAAWTARGVVVALGGASVILTAGVGTPLVMIAGRAALNGVGNLERNSDTRTELDALRFSGVTSSLEHSTPLGQHTLSGVSGPDI